MFSRAIKSLMFSWVAKLMSHTFIVVYWFAFSCLLWSTVLKIQSLHHTECLKNFQTFNSQYFSHNSQIWHHNTGNKYNLFYLVLPILQQSGQRNMMPAPGQILDVPKLLSILSQSGSVKWKLLITFHEDREGGRKIWQE